MGTPNDADSDLPEGSTAESSRKLMDAFSIQDGDQVRVAPIPIQSEGNLCRGTRYTSVNFLP
jgi:hypothetical protein